LKVDTNLSTRDIKAVASSRYWNARPRQIGIIVWFVAIIAIAAALTYLTEPNNYILGAYAVCLAGPAFWVFYRYSKFEKEFVEEWRKQQSQKDSANISKL